MQQAHWLQEEQGGAALAARRGYRVAGSGRKNLLTERWAPGENGGSGKEAENAGLLLC